MAILLLAAVMCIPVVAAGGITAGEVTAIAGQEVTLDIYVSDHNAVDSMGIQYAVPEGLSLVKAEWLLTGMGDVDTGKSKGVWMNMQPLDLTEKTPVFRFTFMVLEPAVNATNLVKEVAANLRIGENDWETVTGKVTVTNPATAISISKPNLQLDPCTGGATLTATVLPATTTDKVVWTSSDENVVTVSDGVITVVGEGTAIVTATAGQQKASCAVAVSHAYGSEWLSDENGHWHKCANGSAVTQVKPHDLQWKIDRNPDDQVDGLQHKECTACGYKTEENTVIPHTHKVTEHAAVTATCTHEGSVRYYTCESKLCEGKLYSNEACTKEITSIVVDKDPENHVKLKLKGQKPANCYQEGYSGDKTCAACGKVLEKGTKVPATGRHTADVAYYSDETHHWHACRTDGCEAKVDYTKHSFHWEVDKAATEYETGLKHEVCGCGKTRSEGTVIEKLDHVHRGIQHVDGVAATCVKEGTLEYWTCVSPLCEGKFYGDPECQPELESIVAPVNPKNHTGKTELKGVKDVTCTEDGYTGDTHCANCGELLESGEVITALGHDLYWVIDRYPTEETEGCKHQTCNTCGYICDADTPIEKLEHLPKLVEEKKPTCEEPGVKAHYYCENCGKYYDASTGAVGDEITADDLVLEALGHSHGSEWVTDAAGHWHSCACGDKADYAEHTPETVGAEAPAVGKPGYTGDTVCSVCGYKIAEGEQIPAETTAPATTVPPTTQAPATQPGEEPGNGGAFWWILVILAAAAAAVAAWLLLGKRKKA